MGTEEQFVVLKWGLLRPSGWLSEVTVLTLPVGSEVLTVGIDADTGIAMWTRSVLPPPETVERTFLVVGSGQPFVREVGGRSVYRGTVREQYGGGLGAVWHVFEIGRGEGQERSQ